MEGLLCLPMPPKLTRSVCKSLIDFYMFSKNRSQASVTFMGCDRKSQSQEIKAQSPAMCGARGRSNLCLAGSKLKFWRGSTDYITNHLR
jgi:hypothetical protein